MANYRRDETSWKEIKSLSIVGEEIWWYVESPVDINLGTTASLDGISSAETQSKLISIIQLSILDYERLKDQAREMTRACVSDS